MRQGLLGGSAHAHVYHVEFHAKINLWT